MDWRRSCPVWRMWRRGWSSVIRRKENWMSRLGYCECLCRSCGHWPRPRTRQQGSEELARQLQQSQSRSGPETETTGRTRQREREADSMVENNGRQSESHCT
uniref:Uncharacterized protein n=1 Tax=Cacopsylla melanoneura TaxID=428564 RepID=A0A8D8M9N2_9HEMI